MSTRVLAVAAAAAASLTLAGCGGSSGASSASSPSLSAGDRSACDALENAGDPPDVDKLYASFGPDGSESPSTEMKPYAMLVGSEAQLAVTGAGDDTKLHEYIGQMRGVCETMGWLAR